MGENRSGWFGGLLASAGFTAIILAPFYLAKRFGGTVIMFLAASVCTFAALKSEQLVAWAKDDHLFSSLAVRPAHRATADMIMMMDDIGWWLVAVVVWLGFLCCFVMDHRQMAKKGRQDE